MNKSVIRIIAVLCSILFVFGYIEFSNSGPMTEEEYISKITVLNDKDNLILNDMFKIINRIKADNITSTEAVNILEEDKIKLQEIIDEVNTIEPPQKFAESQKHYKTYLNILMQTIDKNINDFKTNNQDVSETTLVLYNAMDELNASTDEITKSIALDLNKSFEEFNSSISF